VEGGGGGRGGGRRWRAVGAVDPSYYCADRAGGGTCVGELAPVNEVGGLVRRVLHIPLRYAPGVSQPAAVAVEVVLLANKFVDLLEREAVRRVLRDVVHDLWRGGVCWDGGGRGGGGVSCRGLQ
jgi:hypothetical protein